ncbi:uncharacterized protein LOC129716800 [Wyeomyia smithii]|uniref:uncharacterized protein LOC129716800 n=1 Tax=Wyeomyia smithii TaxID=174621 RepID=UPI002468141D|nr:uncharacterized protein LOC129716800 [Wyeomyia smithii]
MATKNKKLRKKFTARRSALSSLETVEAFIESYEEERDFQQIPVWLDLIDQVFRETMKIQSKIERLDNGDAPLVKHFQERRNFESRDTFKSMVHEVPEIPLVAKLQFLLQALEGEARKPYETVDIESSNYITTWEALLKRYDNQRFLKKQLFRGLHDLNPVRKESPQDIHCLVDDFQRHVKGLAKLGEAVETWDTPLICLLSYKLDSATLRAWEEHASKLETITYNTFVEFLYQQVRILQTVSSEIQHRSQMTPAKVAGPNALLERSFPRTVAHPAVSNSRLDPPNCHSCSEKHLLVQCPTFQNLTVGQRRELVSQKRLCWNCFNSSHIARNCDSKYRCRNCHEQHHTLQTHPLRPKGHPAYH